MIPGISESSSARGSETSAKVPLTMVLPFARIALGATGAAPLAWRSSCDVGLKQLRRTAHENASRQWEVRNTCASRQSAQGRSHTETAGEMRSEAAQHKACANSAAAADSISCRGRWNDRILVGAEEIALAD